MSQPRAELVQHLRELRQRLMYAVGLLLVVFIACYLVSSSLMAFVIEPLQSKMTGDMQIVFINLPEIFFARLKIAFVAALFISSPFIITQLWLFIAPGLYQHERSFFLLMLSGSSILFMIGGFFAYAFVMPLAFEFFLGFSTSEITALPTMQLYVSLVLQLAVAFGLAFEIPLVCVVLAKLGVVSTATMKKKRAWVFVGTFVLGAILTPPDVISQVMLAVPVYLLFELGMLVAKVFEKKEDPELVESV